jgi:hypothetical protein
MRAAMRHTNAYLQCVCHSDIDAVRWALSITAYLKRYSHLKSSRATLRLTHVTLTTTIPNNALEIRRGHVKELDCHEDAAGNGSLQKLPCNSREPLE